jgi:predicted dithiol-disulfide oxidoreductase (DUF899 family)
MTKDDNSVVKDHPVVSHAEWLAARTAFLAKEKEFTRLRDELSRHRRELPWEAVDKKYVFDGPNGKQTLAELFDGKNQLLVYHFMFYPTWEAGCPHCSFWADNFNSFILHLKQRDVTMLAISRAPYGKLAAYKQRMGWNFNWLSSFGTDFNFDHHVSFDPEEQEVFYNFARQKRPGTESAGISVFYKDAAGKVFHTYSAYARGIDILNAAYNYLDLTPKGRDEDGQKNPQFWVRRHDEYSG